MGFVSIMLVLAPAIMLAAVVVTEMDIHDGLKKRSTLTWAAEIILAIGALAVFICSLSWSGTGGDNGGAVDSGSSPAAASSHEPGPQITAAASSGAVSEDDMLDVEFTDDDHTGANVRDATKSTELVSGSEVYTMLADRGFDNVLVSADFALDGSVIDSHLVDSSSADVFPQYYTALDTDAGVFWLLEVDEGSLVALPVRTTNTILERRFMFVEGDTDTVTLYNAASNTFSDWTQDQLGNTTIISVPRIDRDLLEGYTIDWFLERS